MRSVKFLRSIFRLCILVAAAALVACSDSTGDSTGNGTSAAPESPPPGYSSTQTAGVVVLAGRLLAVPYTVEARASTVRINGTDAAWYTGLPAPTPMVYDANSATLNAFELVDLAAAAYNAAGAGPAGISAAVTKLKVHPAAAAASAVDGPIGTSIVIADKSGLEASFRPTAPDASGRSFTDAERAAFAAEAAAAWAAHLAGGGGLVISSTGNVQMIPKADIADLLTSTDRAFTATGDARRAALLSLYDDGVIVDDLLAHYQPRPVPALLQTQSAAPTADPAVAKAGVVGPAGCCKAPGSRKAWVYRTLEGNDPNPFIQALLAEGYQVREYNFHSQRQPAGSGWGALKSTSGAGAVYFVTHSAPSGMTLQPYPVANDASIANQNLRDLVSSGHIGWWRDAAGMWWMEATQRGISGHWQSNDTIVHAASCYSITLADSFNAREFFGYTGISNALIASAHSRKLWRRLTGEDPGDGSMRRASVAFDSGNGYAKGLMMYGTFGNMTAPNWIQAQNWDPVADPTGANQAAASGALQSHLSAFAFRDGSPGSDTVLSPAVVVAQPAAAMHVGEAGLVSVGFDAVMNTRVDPAAVVEVTGCAQPTATGTWNFDSLVNVPVRALTVGTATVTVRASGAMVPSSIRLDGNQNKVTGVVPNQDDYVYNFQCVASQTEPPPGSGTAPPETPQVAVAPTSLTVVHVMGESPCPTYIGAFTVGGSVDGPLNWAVTGMPPWLTLGNTQGSLSSAANPFSVSADFNCNVPSRGIYSGALTVSGTPPSGSPSSKTVNVTVEVR